VRCAPSRQIATFAGLILTLLTPRGALSRYRPFLIATILSLSCTGSAFAYEQLTHQWTGFEAYRMLPDSSPVKATIARFLGSLGGDSTCQNASFGVLGGMWDEDCPTRWLNHFWNPNTDTGFDLDNRGVITGQPAQIYAAGLFSQAVSAYRSGDKSGAYHLLGRVAHLLEDVAQPAHVHNDSHIHLGWALLGVPLPALDSNDNYEPIVSGFNGDYRYDTPRTNDQRLLAFLNYPFEAAYPLKPIPYKELPFRITNARSYPGSRDTFLFRLFFNLAKTADFFESEDSPGVVSNLQFDLPVDRLTFWHQAGVRDSNIPDIPPAFSEPEVPEARLHADVLIPLAMRYVAGLYQLFWDTTHTLTKDAELLDSVAQGAWEYYAFTIPAGAGATHLTVTISNPAGVALYAKYNGAPSASDPCPYQPFHLPGDLTTKWCQIPSPPDGTWIIGVYGVATGTQSYSIKATFSADPFPASTIIAPPGAIGWGASVVFIDDMNGDGVPELAISAPATNVGATAAQGRVYIHDGATGAVLRVFDRPDPIPLDSAGFGSRLAVVGDLEGTGSRTWRSRRTFLRQVVLDVSTCSAQEQAPCCTR